MTQMSVWLVAFLLCRTIGAVFGTGSGYLGWPWRASGLYPDPPWLSVSLALLGGWPSQGLLTVSGMSGGGR